MPLIRQDKPFETMMGYERKRIFNTFASFVSILPISYTVFFADKSFFRRTGQDFILHLDGSIVDGVEDDRNEML